MRNLPATILHLPATALITLIKLYQATLSPDHGWLRHFFPYGFCRHHPTCSVYAIETLRKRPLLQAVLAITQRLFSCHPWKKPSDERLRTAIAKF